MPMPKHVSVIYMESSEHVDDSGSAHGHPADVLRAIRKDMNATADNSHRDRVMPKIVHAIENGGGVVKVNNGNEQDTYIITVNS